MKTTLAKIRAHHPCSDGWAKLLAYLGKTKAEDDEIDLLTILESNGLDDALWCLRAVDGFDREKRLYAVWCSRQVEHLNPDPRVKACNDVAELFANGFATDDELGATRAAWDAAWDAAWGAAWDAAWGAAWDAAGAATARAAAASTGAWAATRAATRAAARGAQKNEFIRMLKEGYPK